MNDRGSGTLLGLSACVLLLGGGIVSATVAGLAVAHQRASVAADLGALAAAGSGCAEAERVVALNGAVLAHCTVTGLDTVVEVAMPGPAILVRLGLPPVVLTGSARAGPGE